MISHSNLPSQSSGLPENVLPEAGRSEREQPPVEVHAGPGPSAADQAQASGAHLWLRRVAVLVFVFLCATIGVMLMILPWRPEWSENHLLAPYPALRAIVTSGFARGLCTGLGVLNVWIGFWEAIKYREE